MYNLTTKTATISQLTSAITIANNQSPPQSPTFTLSGPTSGSYTAGQPLTVTWTAANVPANGVISLCLDADETLWNGNEKWMEVDQVTATNGDGSYSFDPVGITPGTYYVGGYMYDNTAKKATNQSHLTSAITIADNAPKSTNNSNVSNKDYVFSSSALEESTILKQSSDKTNADLLAEIFFQTNEKERQKAIDRILRDQIYWL
jgi:hypothetical protein